LREAGNFEPTQHPTEVWKVMNERGIEVDSHTYRPVVQMYSRSGNENMVEILCKEMEERELDLDVETYNSVIGMYMLRKNYSKANQLWTEMTEREENHAQPNSKSFSLMISMGPKETAEILWQNMLDSGIKPCIESYKSIVSIRALNNDLHGAKEIYDRALTNLSKEDAQKLKQMSSIFDNSN
jgi:pentatricopeptide repeat protein